MEKQTQKNILVVEDEMIISLVIEQMVKNLGHNVIGKVVSGEDAVETALRLKPDLILMDIRLKGEMDGIQAMAEIRKETNIPVIFITGNTDKMYKQRIEQYDYQGFLTKPVTMNELDKTFNFAS